LQTETNDTDKSKQKDFFKPYENRGKNWKKERNKKKYEKNNNTILLKLKKKNDGLS
jgi:hypothetical protein